MCKVLAVDSAAVAGLKERYDGCDQLFGCSPLLMLSVSNKPQKPLALTVTSPPRATGKHKSASGNVAGATSLPRSVNASSSTASSKQADRFGHVQGAIWLPKTRVTPVKQRIDCQAKKPFIN